MKLIWTDAASSGDWPVTVTGCGDVAWYDGSTYTFAASVTVSGGSVEAVRKAAPKEGAA